MYDYVIMKLDSYTMKFNKNVYVRQPRGPQVFHNP